MNKTNHKLEKAQYYNSWMQTIAIFVAGFWILGYNFYYKDVYLPSKSPIHITPKMSLKIGDPMNGFIPISAYMELENESKRDVYVLPGAFIAYGSMVKAIDSKTNDDEFLEHINEIANDDNDYFESKYSSVGQSEFVAGGGVFSGLMLSPNENTSKTYVFYIPENKFDDLEVILQLWAHKGSVNLWSEIKFHNNKSFSNEPCVVIEKNPFKCKPISSGDDGKELRKKLDLWVFEARVGSPLPKQKSDSINNLIMDSTQ